MGTTGQRAHGTKKRPGSKAGNNWRPGNVSCQVAAHLSVARYQLTRDVSPGDSRRRFAFDKGTPNGDNARELLRLLILDN